MPSSLAAITKLMIARRVAAEDMNYTLGLLMTSASAREQGQQKTLMLLLLKAGAAATEESIAAALGHKELAAVQVVLEAGHPLTAPTAAALGRNDALAFLLSDAEPGRLQAALGFAVINGQTAAARIVLSAGADPNQFLRSTRAEPLLTTEATSAAIAQEIRPRWLCLNKIQAPLLNALSSGGGASCWRWSSLFW